MLYVVCDKVIFKWSYLIIAMVFMGWYLSHT